MAVDKIKSLGFVEVSGTVAAIDALDVMCKSADVELVTWERKLGGRMVTIVITGTVSDVSEAVSCAKQNCMAQIMASNVIANPHDETLRLVRLSASRLAKNKN
ncbi:MAG: BMC domain-containing protein [Clostridiales bacterium]|nr:BMC domain-containing protein [Clostridiales bacterium]